jgi:hypothetical protein
MSDVAAQLHFQQIPPNLGDDGSCSTTIALRGGARGITLDRVLCFGIAHFSEKPPSLSRERLNFR